VSDHSSFWPSVLVGLGALFLATTFLFASAMKIANPEPLELMLRWAKVDQRLTRSGVRLLGGGEAALGVGLLLSTAAENVVVSAGENVVVGRVTKPRGSPLRAGVSVGGTLVQLVHPLGGAERTAARRDGACGSCSRGC